ncbi:MAG TPA: nucleotidyltransferase domain-containing protein [Candidatus Thermoplasmatota archaeon]|nr:nucleotidyltransferase domain-containing protein [Candidatus Thermoplasmatota archaeon]
MRTSIQVSQRLRRRLARVKRHARQSYEEVIEAALDAVERVPTAAPEPAGVEEVLRDVRRVAAELYGERVVRLVLYGSHARGDARPGSDVDVLLVLSGDVERGTEIARLVEATYDLLLQRGVHVSVLPMSEREFLMGTTPLLVNVRREGVPI